MREGLLDVLLITSGDPSTEYALRSVLQADAGVEWMNVQRPGAEVFLNSRAAGIWDAYLLHDATRTDDHPRPSVETMRNFAELCQMGHGFVVLHQGAYAWPQWPAWREFVGGVDHPALAGDAAEAPMRGEVHPILEGLEQRVWASRPVSIGGMGTRPLLIQNGRVVAWTNRVGEAEVVYLPIGATAASIEHPEARRLIANSLRWVARNRPGGPTVPVDIR